MILLDTSGLLAALDRRSTQHEACREVLERRQQARLLSPFVLAELDYLLADRVGQEAELTVLDDVARGAYRLETFAADDIDAARAVIEQYRSLALGLADASIVVLADRYDVWELLTLDERHFRTVAGSRGEPFRLLPADRT